ncbi:hypothetical protein B9Z55_001381 [Caenorhabditis nigoni]|uniref:Ribonuclease 3 n=2 Tax=Caenorhabditis nigoni TaxID=1611254 RepID=A0A2G5VFP1_9PELO|nr:hypothetical protein B9Z55_001381 [Caenorhabditis nigoni]
MDFNEIHKRSRRKKFQQIHQDRKDEMIQQLGRRFHNQPSTSATSPSAVEDIPLPSEVPNVFGAPPPLTNADFHRNFLVDPDVVVSHSASLIRSNRHIVKAEDAEQYMMERVGTTAERVLEDLNSRIIKPLKAKRRLQIDVPYIDHPLHSMRSKTPERKENEEDSDSEIRSSDSSSDAEYGSDVGEKLDICRRKKRTHKIQKADSSQTKVEEKERQNTLLRMGIERKRNHPNAIDPHISYNEKGLGNDSPECRCPSPIRNRGLKHGYYAGENQVLQCSRNDRANLHYYTLHVTPAPNESQNQKTQMLINGMEYHFEGFTMVTHAPLPDCMTRRPVCKYSIDYEFQLIEEFMPTECFDPEDCNSIFEYIFHDIFELLDFDLYPKHLPPETDSCPTIHIMPRFVALENNTTFIWSSKTVLAFFLLHGEKNMFSPEDVEKNCAMPDDVFGRTIAKLKQSIVLNPIKKPSALRADWFSRDLENKEMFLIQNTIRSQHFASPFLPQIAALEKKMSRLKQEKKDSGNKNPHYENLKAELIVLKDKHREARQLKLKLPVKDYIDTGLKPDVVAHVAMAIIASHHIRYNFSLSVFEKVIEYKFNDRRIVELALIHSSFRSYYGTTPDHVKNMISNCGYRKKYGAEERREKKKGIISLFNIMGGETSGGEPILHNERLEYLGDAVVELIASHHLFFILNHHFEGGLATYRTALVQNRNLAKLAMNCRIDEMLQFAHGADLINEAEWKHALANAFEALMAAVFLDSGIAPCDAIFSKAMYGKDPEMKKVWDHLNEHELKIEDPLGDRELSRITPALTDFHRLEQIIGIEFNNIRLLAKAFTRRNVPFNDLTKGHNQRLEWLGDSVLQLIISDYLYRNFPLHHEGHMSLLRTSLVSNQTQSVVCDDLGFQEFVIKAPHRKNDLKMKDKADLVEAFIGALYVDKGLEYCRSFIRTVFCPRLKHFINSEQWNDAKSHLQQWCLAIRDSRNPNPAMPEYRLLGIQGPTNNRIFRVAVYFRGERLSSAAASNMHTAELKAAENALAALEKASFSRMREKNMSGRQHRLHRIFFS